MKKFSILLFILFASCSLFSQGTHLNYFMRKKVAMADNLNEKIFLLVKGNVEAIKQFVLSNNGKFINSAGDIASVQLSMEAVSVLIQKPFVKQIGSESHQLLPMNDTMRLISHVDEVHAGETPLPKSYKGKGVLIGIIDSGIDFSHPDFKDSTGHTRVKWLWDMNLPDSANSPSPFDYGQEFSGDQIDNGLASAHTGLDQFGHGTYVTGIAAGNGSAVGRFHGVAPEADLIVVGYKFNAQDNVARIAHAVDYIF